MFSKFKEKYGIQSNWQVAAILATFSLAGSLSVYLSKPILNYFNISRESLSSFTFWPLRILIIFPIYQLSLIITGTLLGQFSFFWNFQKKTIFRKKKRK